MIDMNWKEVVKFDEREAASRVQKTGYCRRCQKMVTKYQKCDLSLPAPSSGIKPSCPMRESARSNRGDSEKMAGAVSTSSSPSMFNVTYSNNKDDEENAR
tara:strand:+ start:298 stop:597 length:300 start_codon:yes stop_codon:yes gene_type:complete